MKQKRVIPAFESEAKEAEWWRKNRATLDRDLTEAAKKGDLKRLAQATLKARLASSRARVVSIRLCGSLLVVPFGQRRHALRQMRLVALAFETSRFD